MKEITVEGILCVINSLDNIEISIEQLEDSLTNLGVDSISFIQIIVGLEEAFDCEIPDTKLLISEMDTVRKMFDVLQNLYEIQLA